MKALAFILPPLAGAIIGYVTNAVAVRMLFRPLKALYIGRWKLPFTPGILPRERGRLADSIGAMVERELLTPAVLAERLNSGGVKEKILRAAGDLVVEKSGEWYPSAVSGLVLSLSRPPVRGILEEQGRLFLSKIVLSLNVFQRFFVSAAGYDKTLSEKMPHIIDDFLRLLEETLQKEAVQKKCFDLLKTNLEKAGDFQVSEEQTAALLDSVDVRALVRDRVNSLDMLTVEGIILDVMAGELKWINLFGGIIGALIGAAQVGFSFLLR